MTSCFMGNLFIVLIGLGAWKLVKEIYIGIIAEQTRWETSRKIDELTEEIIRINRKGRS